MDLTHPNTRLLIDECKKADLLRNQCAYVLATAWHETGAYRYMREVWGPTAAQKRYESRKDLGNTVKGDGKKFLGRGFVQITGRRNYADWSKRLGIDLIKQPQLAEQPDTAARIIVDGMMLGTFTGKTLADYITLTKSDFHGARRIVNGTDKAELIAGYAIKFDALLKAEGYGAAKPADAPQPVAAPELPPKARPAPAATAGRNPNTLTAIIAAAAVAVGAAWSWLAGLPCEYLNLFCG